MEQFRVNRIYLLYAGIFLSLAALSPPSGAAAMRWELRFFNDAGGFAGHGTFAYNTSTRTLVESKTSGSISFSVSTALTDFSASILGQDWGFESPSTTWWSQDNIAPGQQLSHPFGTIREQFWFFGNPASGSRQLTLTDMFQETSGPRWSGNWTMRIADASGQLSAIEGAGHWLAAPVPVPAALPLFASALAALGLFSFRKRANPPSSK